ncbi:substrate-binding domain-containing protein [Pseudomonas haemolytica]|uniref:Phosphate-binding protein PstS n=1 Tax=Pseudomonas haemolytica TaxID=2600065 RepID=A0A5P1DIZ0_9PSED|nr:substrate-binding domain-containing protein [Pseudomonas haemolytica]MBJ2248147.1 substrate-binding domain-containing protein [Pseudomonas haemolytica]MBJ2274340.1 substrate-binding domain-containing protein [Pseudomonas haemolytica]MBK3448845.1 substrate-binding domain-containing protein [Pseudomonas haemolytica]MBK3460064.1 substrate-binding domain-containing protein [Pseudomonas haemolytica]MRJ39468.1 alkaline phosphatase [Pseudomonas haemolytica]
MFKRTMIAASLVVAALASAQSMAAVVGGGATLPEKLYGTTAGTGILASSIPGFNAYIGVGSGGGKKAFFGNDSTQLKLAAGITVDYAGSDSIVSGAELLAYNNDAVKGRPAYGALIQVPAAATSVTVPYHINGKTSLKLTSVQLANIFAGVTKNWNEVLFDGVAGPNLPIKVVYRTETSGTTEILTTHLKAVSGNLLPVASNSFATAVGFNPAVNPPAGTNYIGVVGSQGVAAAVADANNNGAIGYVSPDYAQFNDASAVAAINGALPTEVNVQVTLDTVAPPALGSNDAKDPLKWVPTFANPTAGYPIVGYTNLVFSQCYKDTTDTARIRNFLNRHYTGLNNAAVSSHSFIPLSATWQKAVHDNFYATTSALRLGDTNTCNGIGRPL